MCVITVQSTNNVKCTRCVKVISSPSFVKLSFDTDSTKWRELVPRQRIGDCSEIHVLRFGLCAQPLSRHQTFLQADVLISVFREVSLNTVLAKIHTSLVSFYPSLSFNKMNLVKPVHASDNFLSPSTLQ